MTRDNLPKRIRDQFSYRDERSDIWRGFQAVLDVDRFLNLGYSPWYLPHFLGASQRRLATEIGDGLTRRLSRTEGVRLLDAGCGRGGPAIHFSNAFGFDVIGVDFVPYNVVTARKQSRGDGAPADFLVGDLTDLPLRDGSVPVCVSVDSIVYVPQKSIAFREMARVLQSDGVVAVSDLVAAEDVSPPERQTVDAFAEAWDMPPLTTAAEYTRLVEDVGLAVETVRDLSAHSVDRFRKWSWLYLSLVERFGSVVERGLRHWGLDPDAITEQVRRAHAALPHLRHLIVFASPRT